MVFDVNDLDEDMYGKLIDKATKIKMRARGFRVASILCIPVLFLTLNEVFDSDEKNETQLLFTFGVSLLLMYIAYFIHLFFVVTGFGDHLTKTAGAGKEARHDGYDLKFKRIHRIYSVNVVYPSWAGMTFTGKTLLFKNHAITSISEFSAIMGGTANAMLIIISSYGFAVLICGIGAEQVTRGFDFTFDIFAELIGIYGTVLIGAFELDKFSKQMVFMHYVGVVFALFTLAGFIFQAFRLEALADGKEDPWRIYVSIFLTLFGMVTGALWTFMGQVAKAFAHNKDTWWTWCGCACNCLKIRKRDSMQEAQVAKYITKLTYLNIFFEGCAIFSGALATCLWLMSFDTCQCYGCYGTRPEIPDCQT